MGILFYNSQGTIDISQCTDTATVVDSNGDDVIDPDTDTLIDPCKVLDSAIDSNDNYYLLTPNSVWNFTNSGVFVGKSIEDLDFGFRMEIDNANDFFIMDVGPQIKKFSRGW